MLDRELRGGAIVVFLIAGVIAAGVLTSDGSTPEYRPSGQARDLPAAQLEPTSAGDFGGILLGLRGTPIVVNVWASWCPPCRAEMPLLNRAAEDFAGRVVFIGVASKDSPAAAGAFLEEVGVTYVNVFDASGDIRSDLGLAGFPTTYLFDAEGELREAVVGGITEQRLAAQLEDLLR